MVLAVGSLCTFNYLAYIYVESRSVWVTALAHIALNNSAASLSYFALIQDQLLANIGLALTMIIVVAVLCFTKELGVYQEYFQGNHAAGWEGTPGDGVRVSLPPLHMTGEK